MAVTIDKSSTRKGEEGLPVLLVADEEGCVDLSFPFDLAKGIAEGWEEGERAEWISGGEREGRRREARR